MRKRFQSVMQLALWQKLVIGAMLLLILLTWLAICLVITGFFGP